jgi:hypothetical protein
MESVDAYLNIKSYRGHILPEEDLEAQAEVENRGKPTNPLWTKPLKRDNVPAETAKPYFEGKVWKVSVKSFDGQSQQSCSFRWSNHPTSPFQNGHVFEVVKRIAQEMCVNTEVMENSCFVSITTVIDYSIRRLVFKIRLR